MKQAWILMPQWWLCTLLNMIVLSHMVVCMDEVLRGSRMSNVLYRSEVIYRMERQVSEACQEQEDIHSASDSETASIHNLIQFNTTKDGSEYHRFSMFWAGKNNNTQFVALMDDSGTIPSEIFRSTDRKNFHKVPIGGRAISQVTYNPRNNNHIILIVFNRNISQYEVCVTLDGGETDFECGKLLDSHIPSHSLTFKDNNVMTILTQRFVFSALYTLVISEDFGRPNTFRLITKNAMSAQWHPYNSNIVYALIEETSIFSLLVAQYLKKIDLSKNPPSVSTLPGLQKTEIKSFQYLDEFLYVFAQSDQQAGQFILKMSTDDGETFNATHLPVAVNNEHISILDTSEKLIFAQVPDASDETMGSLYTSGEDGLQYSLSLSNHISSDFYRVRSITGVYLTTRKLNDESLESVISLDRGASWSPIHVKNQDNKQLLVFSNYLIADYRLNKGSILAQSPYSLESAKGLIVVHGVLGDKIRFNSLEGKYEYNDTPSLFISGDGGFTWNQVLQLNGAHHVAVTDSGGIITAVPMFNNNTSSVVKYSVDGGQCWHSYEFSFKLNTTDVMVQPGQKSLSISLVGYPGDAKIPSWILVDIDFKSILKRKCDESSDLEFWNERKECFLGQIRTFKRVKSSSWCYLGEEFENAVNSSICECTILDFECAYGYTRNDDLKCTLDPAFENNKVLFCSDKKQYELQTSGYRKIPGNKCDNSKEVVSVTERVIALNKSCDEADVTHFLSEKDVKEKVCGVKSSGNVAAVSEDKHQDGLVAAVIILALLVIVLCSFLIITLVKLTKLRRQYDYQSFGNEQSPAVSAAFNTGANTPQASETAGFASSDLSDGRSYGRLRELDSDVEVIA